MLYISSFAFNLISVSKLVSTTPYQMTFTYNVCFIQDARTKMKIGSVDVQGGLYQLIPHHFKSHFIHSTIIHPKCDVIPIDLWHFHLGLLSKILLATLVIMPNSINFLFHQVILLRHVLFLFCIWTYGDPTPYLPYMVIDSFLPL